LKDRLNQYCPASLYASIDALMYDDPVVQPYVSDVRRQIVIQRVLREIEDPRAYIANWFRRQKELDISRSNWSLSW
jgi:hypothetical protein